MAAFAATSSYRLWEFPSAGLNGVKMVSEVPRGHSPIQFSRSLYY
jgi:hypothetical protein